LQKLVPSGGLLNLPLYSWRSIYTTNYDALIEKVFARSHKLLTVFSSNFDFGNQDIPGASELFKLHGTIEKDSCDGHNSRMIISVSDYDITEEYREQLYERFQHEISTGTLLIIGQTLADPDLRVLVDEAIRRRKESGAQSKIILFLYERDENRALIYEGRGIEICFGGLDEFFSQMAINGAEAQLVLSVTSDPMDAAPEINPSTIDAAHSRANESPNLAQMFNGRPANYADIAQEWTFERDRVSQIETQFAGDHKRVAYVLGVAGVGKTSLGRQVLSRLINRDIRCWEHKRDFDLPADGWIKLDRELRKRKEVGVLFIDDAHEHLREINYLVEALSKHEAAALKLLLVSSRPHWNPRLKSPAIFSHGHEYSLSKLSEPEINKLLGLVEGTREIRELVEQRFLGFSFAERRRRLVERCRKDMFVCLKNIFGFQGINTIILQEFAALTVDYQEIYRSVAAMESSGVRVHRQLVIRVVGIQASQIQRTLDDLTGIVEEYSINEKKGIYGWKVRHSLIADIIAEHKYSSQDEIYDLLMKVIDNINPTYGIEVKSIRDICDMNRGIGRVYDKARQNVLLRHMISLAPAERVPRHRLITNLIDQSDFDMAENEIRIFEKEVRVDGPVHRYKIRLKLALAKETEGIMDSDRAAMAQQAASMAVQGLRRFSDDKNMYAAYFDAGIAYFKYCGNWDIYEDAMSCAKEAEDRIMDPDLRRVISRNERLAERIAGNLD